MKVLILIIVAEVILVSCAVSTFPPSDAAGESANRIAELVAAENGEVNGE